MSERRKHDILRTFAEYLEDEQQEEFRHELVAGRAYAMAGATATHNQISLNAASAIDDHLADSPCLTFMNDMKLRVRLNSADNVYYPDVFVTCEKDDSDPLYKEKPDTIIEVLSNSTEATDRREKRYHYTSIPTLNNYILVSQKKVEVTILRRVNSWRDEIFYSMEDAIALPSLKLKLSLARIYRKVDFAQSDPPTELEIYHPELS